jgi:hypothetical protein
MLSEEVGETLAILGVPAEKVGFFGGWHRDVGMDGEGRCE